MQLMWFKNPAQRIQKCVAANQCRLHVVGLQVDAIRALLAAGADLEARAKDGLALEDTTPLFAAVAAGQVAAAQILMAAGASLEVCDTWTPLHQAANSGSVKMARLLLQVGRRPCSALLHRLLPTAAADLASACGHLLLHKLLRCCSALHDWLVVVRVARTVQASCP